MSRISAVDFYVVFLAGVGVGAISLAVSKVLLLSLMALLILPIIIAVWKLSFGKEKFGEINREGGIDEKWYK